VPPDERHIHAFVDVQQRDTALALEPDVLERLLWGGKVVGLRVFLPHADPPLNKLLIRQAWARKAPKKLLAQIDLDLGHADG